MKRYLNAFIVIMTLMAVGFGIIGFIFSEQLLLLIGTPESILGEAQTYLQISFLGMFFLFAYNFVNTVLRALGASKTPNGTIYRYLKKKRQCELNSPTHTVFITVLC